jgi:hypothetical protein
MALGGFARRLSGVLEPSSEGGKYVQVILEEAARLEETLSRMSKAPAYITKRPKEQATRDRQLRMKTIQKPVPGPGHHQG